MSSQTASNEASDVENRQPSRVGLTDLLGGIRVDSSNLKATVCGVEYTWSGGFGAVIKSFERGVKLNDVRMIGNIVFYAYMVGRSGWLREIAWCPQQDIDAQWIRDFKAVMFR